MSNSFTDWDRELSHHGIPGMKRGVRRYQNEDGSLTALGKERYGSKNSSVKPRKAQRDYNNLDIGYANVRAEGIDQRKFKEHYKQKADKRASKKKLDADEQRASDKKYTKYMKRSEQAGKNESKTKTQMRSIRSLQNKILNNATKKGYTIKSKEVYRFGKSEKDRRNESLAGAFGINGGAIGGAISAGVNAAIDKKNGVYDSKMIKGTQVKIRKPKKK